MRKRERAPDKLVHAPLGFLAAVFLNGFFLHRKHNTIVGLEPHKSRR